MTDESDSCAFLYVIGAPASGKGTLCKRLAQDHGFVHLSVGDLLRKHMSDDHAAVDQATIDSIRNNELLSLEALQPIVMKAIERFRSQGNHKFILDGFPRRVVQAVAFEALMGPPSLVLFFDCRKEVAERRFLVRKIPGREDNKELFDRRYKEFTELNPQIVGFYESRGILLKLNRFAAGYKQGGRSFLSKAVRNTEPLRRLERLVSASLKKRTPPIPYTSFL